MMIIPDNETDIDLLYYEAISKTIVDLLESERETPITIGVHGDWGAGKSSILKMLEAAYGDNDDTLCIIFNGWLFQGFEDTKAVLIETIIEELLDKRTVTEVLKQKAISLLKRINWMKVARKMGGLTFASATSIPDFDQSQYLVEIANGVIGKAGEFTGDNIQEFLRQAEGYLKNAEPESIPAQMHAFRKEFSDLLKEAKVKRLVVIVDDLDRCLPETAIETLEAIRLFLFVPGAAFVIAADEVMIEYAVRKHFPDLPHSTGPATYAQNYLEKLIQVPFRLPSLGFVETRTYITLLMSERALTAEHESFIALKSLAREVLRRPWDSDGFGRAQIENLIGDIPFEVESAIQIADQIAPILTEGARGNPRQIKRFLNTMTLRLAIAKQREIIDDIKIPVLSKLMLAERFDTDLYDRIGRETNIEGKSSTLSQLESIVIDTEDAEDETFPDEKKVRRKAAKAGTLDKSEVLTEENEISVWLRRWVALEPRLGEVDLRPYLFISRDGKAIFSSSAALPQMDAWVEKLCGGRLEAKAIAKEIAKLSSAEAERYFNAVLARVRGAENFLNRPAGVFGLIEICKVHPPFQSAIIALLESIAPDTIGPWAVTGWLEVFTTPTTRSAFKGLCESWAAQDGNQVLKVAATATVKAVKT